jgi:type IV pilus assembly protein PilM
MLGLSDLFMSAWGALAKTRPLEEPAKAAQQVADQANKHISDFTAAKAAFTSLKGSGETLVADTPETASWPALLQTVMATLPNPAQELKDKIPDFDPTVPTNIPLVGMLRVHVDKILPVYRSDVKTEWFDTLDTQWLNFMQPYDIANPPSGPGWIVQVVGHHYNPSRLTKDLSDREKQFALGPEPYISREILPRFWDPRLRLLGVHHAVLTSFYPDREWTTDKGASAVPPPQLLARAEPPADAAGTDVTGGGGMTDMMSYRMGRMGAMGRGGMSGGMSGGMGGEMGMAGMMMQERMGRGMGMGMGMGPGMGAATKKEDIDYLTRTDFKIEFLWQPPNPTDLPKTDEERIAKIQELAKAMVAENEKKKGAIQFDETALAKLSEAQSKQALDTFSEEMKKEQEAASSAAEAATPGAATQPAATPSAAPGTTPAGAAPQ